MHPRWTLTVLALSISCSTVGVKGPTTGTADALPPCTRSYALPAVDIVAAIGVLLTAYAAASFQGFDCVDPECGDTFEPKVFAVGAIIAAPFVLSAGVGASRIGRCEQAQRAWTADQAALGAQRRRQEAISTRDPAAWASARDSGLLGKQDQWCRTTTAAVLIGTCDGGLVCDDGTCRRRCHETTPGSRMWTCGPGYRCTVDHAGCDLVTPAVTNADADAGAS